MWGPSTNFIYVVLGGTGKDRAARAMIDAALPLVRENESTLLVEGTSGSTGISLAHLCRSLGLKLHVFLPDDQVTPESSIHDKQFDVVIDSS
jgi:cysteine synthase A